MPCKEIERAIEESGEEGAFYLASSSRLDYLYEKWLELLPRVDPFYAVKCNNDPVLIEKLAKFQKMGFDCASSSEISLVLNAGVTTERIIYANTCKGTKHLKFAEKTGVKRMTFDSESEAVKIANLHPQAELVIRISVKEHNAHFSFNGKFGVSLQDAERLLCKTKDLSLKVVGVAFHIGSGAKDPEAYHDAIKDCRRLFDYAINVLNLNFYLLDLGGGFSSCFEGEPAEHGLPFEKSAKVINETLDKYFPDEYRSLYNIRVIAEPGRYFCQSVYTVATVINNKKSFLEGRQILSGDARPEPDRIVYHMDQGIYSAFFMIWYDFKAPNPLALYTKGRLVEFKENLEGAINSSVVGPTCDGLDFIYKEIRLPEMDEGDWMIYDHSGAYTYSLYSDFNGFPQIPVKWI